MIVGISKGLNNVYVDDAKSTGPTLNSPTSVGYRLVFCISTQKFTDFIIFYQLSSNMFLDVHANYLCNLRKSKYS